MKDPVILITVDVEDWFQVENFKECIPFSSWPSRELRVERNTHKLLDLFDEVKLENTEYPSTSLRAGSRQKTEGRGQETEDRIRKTVGEAVTPTSVGNKQRITDDGQQITALGQLITENCEQRKLRATFFVLGWIAERLPNLVREIQARGHEVASHGYHHEMCTVKSCADLEKDLFDSKKVLEDIIGAPVHGYRAPSFSVSDDILRTIQECGYLYDSSYNSFAMHARYGKVNLSENGTRGVAILINQKSAIENRQFYELPISNLNIAGRVVPWGGGGYFRLIPNWIFKKGIRRILSEQGGYTFYMHPWEVDPDQPRVQSASRGFRFRHYVNLARTEQKLKDMFHHFSDCRFVTCHEYLKEVS